MTRRLWSLHAYVGLYGGLVIAFLSVTGTAALFREELDVLLRPDLYRVEARAQLVDMASVTRAVLRKHPDKVLSEVALPPRGAGSWNIRLAAKTEDELFPVFWEVFVDPYSGKILGERNYYESFSYYLRNLHVRIYEGWQGRFIVGLAGLALLFTLISGAILYFPFQKRRGFWTIRRKNLRVKQADYHKLIGVLALVFNLVIAGTGAWLGLQPAIMKATGMKRPGSLAAKPALTLSPADDTLVALRYDLALEEAFRQNPNFRVRSMRPSDDGSATVELLGDVRGQVYERASNRLTFDKRTLAPGGRYLIGEAGFGDKLFYVQEALHFGDYGGPWLKLLYAGLGLTTGFLAVSGFVVYVERTKSKAAKAGVFVDAGVLLRRYGLGMLGFCGTLAVLTLWIGIGVPTVLVTTVFYGGLVVWVGRVIWGRVRVSP